MTSESVCPCSLLAECDCHACCGNCPDSPEFWCGDCWNIHCKVHHGEDITALFQKIDAQRPSLDGQLNSQS